MNYTQCKSITSPEWLTASIYALSVNSSGHLFLCWQWHRCKWWLCLNFFYYAGSNPFYNRLYKLPRAKPIASNCRFTGKANINCSFSCLLTCIIMRFQMYKDKSEEREAESLRKLAFFGIAISTVATLTAIVVVPMLYNYMQHVQSSLQVEVDFCIHRSDGLWNEYRQVGSYLNHSR